MLFGATILIQRSEWDFAQTRRFEGMLDEARLRTDLPVAKIEGDYDVFGDGTVQIIATPSVTPGNQSLLVKMPNRGAILLSGDVIHFQSGSDHRTVPGTPCNNQTPLPPLHPPPLPHPHTTPHLPP